MAARYSFSRSLWPASRACRSCSIALLAICFACSTFMFSVLLFRGVLAPFNQSRGSKDEKQGTDGMRRLGGIRSGGYDFRAVLIQRRENGMKRTTGGSKVKCDLQA